MNNIFILVDNFFPAYKGGGPIQSITNLITCIEGEYDVYVITSAYDLRSTIIMQGIKPDTWNEVILPGSNKATNVWYADNLKPGYNFFKKLVKEIQPASIYLNGIFSYNLFLIPLIAIKNSLSNTKLIICPRGMLQRGALADKAFKKKIYLKFLKFSGLVNKAVWHATSEEEKEDVVKHFVINKEVVIAMNIPKKPVENIDVIEKIPGSLKLIYLSLITEKKNLLLLLRLIRATENISLDIYGPVKDKAYWNECLKLINEMHYKIKYYGDVVPTEVQRKFSSYHASALLTKGENFGHALYESLSAGRPVITSNFTPWDNLKEKNAGWNLDITNTSESIIQLNKIKEFNQAEYSNFCTGAYQMAKEYYSQSINLSNYKKIFD